MASPGPEDGGARQRSGRRRKPGPERERRTVQLGDQLHRWNRVKSQLNLQSDEAVARTLLDAGRGGNGRHVTSGPSRAPVTKMASPGPEDGGARQRSGRRRKPGPERERRTVQLGDQLHRWNRVKSQLNLQSDEAVARTLLDAFIKIHMSPSSPSHAVLEICIGEEGAVNPATVRKEHEAVHNTIPFWPSGAIGKGGGLAAQSASWKKGRARESKPRGKRSRSGRMARPGPSSSPDLPKAVCESQRAGQAGERVPLGRLTLPLEDASRGRPRRDGLRQRHGVFIGDQAARWNSVKTNLNVRSDEEMARILLDVFIERRMNQPGPSRTVREAGRGEEAAVTCDSVKDDNEQDDLDSFLSLSPSAGSESTVTLSHPSSIGSLEDDTDVDLFSGADSVSESNSKSPGMVSRRSERLPLPNHEMKVEAGEWESGCASHGFEHCNLKNKGTDPRNEEMDPTVPSNTLPEETERQSASDGEILKVCIGEGGVSTWFAIKKEQEELCSLPSPVASAGSESTVTLSHPSSDISIEEDCLAGTAVVSESETEGLEMVTSRRKQPALPDDETKGRNPRWGRPGTLDIGEEIERWNFLKDHLKLKSDEEMARALLDLYTETHAVPSSPLTLLPAFAKKV